MTKTQVKYPDFDIEKGLFADYKYISGIDEAGRGALAGPVFAAAVILPLSFPIDIGINDSKKLNPKQREILYEVITTNSLSFSISYVDNNVIDEINILKATFQSMINACEGLSLRPDFLIIDGNRFPEYHIPHRTIIKGDSISISIAAASILAKVARDKWMVEVAHELYPQYGFPSHKGYGTKNHIKAIFEQGPSPLHRLTFLKKLNKKQLSLF